MTYKKRMRILSDFGSRWPNGKSVRLETRGNLRLWVRIPTPAGSPRLLPGCCTVGCPLLQVCTLGWVKCREHISLLIIFCIIVYVTNKAHPSFTVARKAISSWRQMWRSWITRNVKVNGGRKSFQLHRWCVYLAMEEAVMYVKNIWVMNYDRMGLKCWSVS